jgi:hypothetical protein
MRANNRMEKIVGRSFTVSTLKQILLVGSNQGRPLGRQEHRWEDNIKMNLKEIVCGLNSASRGRVQWQALVNMIMKL